MGNSVARSRFSVGARARKWIAGTAAGALVVGLLVAGGVQIAHAAGPAPTVTGGFAATPIAGGDVVLDLNFSNKVSPYSGEFNLSAGLVLPVGVTIADPGGLGAATRVFAAGQTISASAGSTQCVAMGLVAQGGACVVPAGKQYFVFENVSDLPKDAGNSVQLTLRPDASIFDVGHEIPFVVSGFTSNNENLIPLFPGSSSNAANANHTSDPGIASGKSRIEAFQLTKTSNQPENEILRGVHDNFAEFTLTVKHTGEGDISNVKVVDYLPAWMEYLGSGATENTRNANGNAQQLEEYLNSGPLGTSPALAGWVQESAISTVKLNDAEAEAAGLGANAGGIYTKVEWSLANLLASAGTAQALPAKGTPGTYELKYRAGIPLFSNTMDFVDGTPTPESLSQGSNLDNNTGVSTRQGQQGDPWTGSSVTNTATVSGDYTLKDTSADPRVVRSESKGSESLEVLDVRLLKSVNDGEFKQGSIATYTLKVKASEYVDAKFAAGADDHLWDDLGDGLCPTFPFGVPVTGAGSIPELYIGDPGDNPTLHPNASTWNAALGAASADCGFPLSAADNTDATFNTTPAGKGTLTSITFDPATGRYFVEFALAPIAANEEIALKYTASQNPSYAEGEVGGTSSGDSVRNNAQILMSTDPTSDTAHQENSAGIGVGGDMRAVDTSHADLVADLSRLSKEVLSRSAGTVTAGSIATVAEEKWNAEKAPEPFMVGDEVWYRISLKTPGLADVRNPKLSDVLPANVALAGNTLTLGQNYVVVPSTNLYGMGLCVDPSGGWTPDNWAAKFVTPRPGDSVVVQPDGKRIVWNLGSTECVTGNTTDRFLPKSASLTFYIKGIVTGASAPSTTDLPQNLVKYQQQSRDADGGHAIAFMRDSAEFELVGVPSLKKGIESNSFAGITRPPGFQGSNYPAGTLASTPNGFGSNVDGQNVVQGNEVTFRIDVTAPESSIDSVGSTGNYVVWDALPVGMTKANLAGVAGNPRAVLIDNGTEVATELPSSAFTATAYDPGNTGYPANVRAPYNTRTIIVWTLNNQAVQNSIAAGEATVANKRGFSLKYTVKIPEGLTGAALQQNYVNTASIVQYEGLGQGGTSTGTVAVPLGSDTLRENPTTTVGQVPSAGTVDNSNVVVPNAVMEKRLVSTEIGPLAATPAPESTVGLYDLDSPANTQTRIVQGELATYEFSVLVPANTTVKNGVLSDDGSLKRVGTNVPYNVVGDPVFLKNDVVTTNLPSGFTLVKTSGAKHGVLTFPAEYLSGNAPEKFSVRITVWVNDADATNPNYTPNLAHSTGTNLVNTARFTKAAPTNGSNTALSDTANVQYVEPNIGINKTASHTDDTVASGDTITYSVTASNAADWPASYDNVVVDTVPAGLSVNVAALKLAYPGVILSDEAALASGVGGTITWTSASAPGLAKILGNTSVVLTYTATLIPSAGAGDTFTNNVKVTGQTLPATGIGADSATRRGDRAATSSAEVTAVGSTLTKGVRQSGSTGVFGESTTAPIGATAEYEVKFTLYKDINYYGARVDDVLPDGATLVPGSMTVTVDDTSGSMSGTDWVLQTPGVGNDLRWNYNQPGGNIAPGTVDRTVTLKYSVLLSNTVPFATQALPNTAAFSWGTATNTPEDKRKSTSDTATVNVLNPVLAIDKQVNAKVEDSFNPDGTLPYTVRVTNTGTTPAYNMTVVDCLPAGVTNITGISNGGQHTPATATCPGGVITWTLAGPLQHANGTGSDPKAIDLSYNAKFVASGSLTSTANGTGAWLQNTVNVTEFESFGSGGREYTPGISGQPVISDTARVRALFPQVTLQKAAASGTTAYVGAPFAWKLSLVNTGQGTAQTIVATDVLPKNWSYDPGSAQVITSAGTVSVEPAISAGTGADAGKTVLTWNLGAVLPGNPALPGAAGGATLTQRTAEITFSAVPAAGALTDAGVGLSVAHTNTLRAVTTDTTGATSNSSRPHTGGPSTADAFLGSADLAIAKVGASAPIHAGTANALGWTMTVTNNGPDTAEGPITVSDVTSALPAGVRVTSASGTGWTCEVPTRDAGTGVTEFDCSRTNTGDSLALDASFPVINVYVTVDADQLAVAADTIVNTATVNPGKTHDPDAGNNVSRDDITIDTLADLTIVKTVSGAAPVNVGDPISWQISAWNAGPSVSQSTSAKPITISDTVPAGVTGVTATSNSDWVATLADGSPIPVAGVGAGAVIMWTYQGSAMPTLPTKPATVGLSGTVLTSHTGAIANTAVVAPQITPEPTVDPLTNTSTVTVTPLAETTLGVVKERVVPDGTSGWRTADPTTNPGDALVAGDPIHYRVVVTNNGPADAQNVQVVDEVPAGLTYSAVESIAPANWTRASGGSTSTSTGSVATWDTFTLTGTQPAGSTRTFVVSYATAAATILAVENCVEATAGNWSETAAAQEARACNSSASTRVVDLGITKTHTGAGPFAAGTAVPYTITVTNHGPSASDGPFTVTDALPAGMSYVAGSAMVSVAGGTATALAPALSGTDSRMLTWTVPLASGTTLAPNATIVITLSAFIDQNVRGAVTLTNTAVVSGPENEPTGPDAHPNTTTDSVTTSTYADMTIVKDVTTPVSGVVVAGTDVTYTLTVANVGPSAAPASVTDTLPAGLSFVSVNGTGWTCPVVSGAPTGDCSYTANSGLHPVGTSTITVVAHVSSNVQPTAALPATGLVNVAELSWSDSRGSHDDDDPAEIRIVTDADLGIVKHVITEAEGDVVAEPAEAIAGESVWYRLQVSNLGASDATGTITVTDKLPIGVTVPSTLTAVGPWSVEVGAVDAVSNRQTVTFTLAGGLVTGTTTNPFLAPVIEFEAYLDPSIADSTTLVNDADVASPTDDSNPDNNEDSASILVNRSADLAVSKSHAVDDRGQVHIDEPLDFTILVTNAGPSDASGIVVTDTFPAGFEVTSVVGPVLGEGDVPTGWTIDSVELVDPADPLGGTTVVASYAGVLGISADDSAAPPLVLTAIPRESALGTDPNHVQVEGAEFDPELENNEWEDPIDVRPRVTLITEKTAVGKFQVGKVGEYLITVENAGPHGDPGPISVVDVLPDGLTFQASPDLPSGVDFERDGDTITWTIVEGLDVDEKIELRLLVNVAQAAFPSVINTVTVDSPAEKTPDSVLTDSATVTVSPADPLVVTGGDIAAGLLAAMALLLLAGGAAYSVGRRRQRAAHTA